MSTGNGKSKSVKFTLDGKEVEALEGETIWQVAKRSKSKPRTCAIPRSPATAPTAIAAPAWSKSKVSAYSRQAASASQPKA